MKAKILKLAQNGKNHSNDKELVGAYSVVVATAKGLKEVVTARSWMGRSRSASRVYATVWISGKDIYGAGSSSAGGYGYHKESSAFAYAIRSAGIELDRDIAGVGDSAMMAAFEAIARALGYKGKLLVVRH